jgi:hypothetical protein
MVRSRPPCHPPSPRSPAPDGGRCPGPPAPGLPVPRGPACAGDGLGLPGAGARLLHAAVLAAVLAAVAGGLGCRDHPLPAPPAGMPRKDLGRRFDREACLHLGPSGRKAWDTVLAGAMHEVDIADLFDSLAAPDRAILARDLQDCLDGFVPTPDPRWDASGLDLRITEILVPYYQGLAPAPALRLGPRQRALWRELGPLKARINVHLRRHPDEAGRIHELLRAGAAESPMPTSVLVALQALYELD